VVTFVQLRLSRGLVNAAADFEA
ncbi:MAG: hypothetical protein JWO42_1824, partial [Chloroflexi bacterium]|nr:hypothetical protein [Chloroflexota bacterium]